MLRWMLVTSRHHDRFRVAAARLLGSGPVVDILDEVDQQLEEAQRSRSLEPTGALRRSPPNGVRL
jgi:hypothetical protein